MRIPAPVVGQHIDLISRAAGGSAIEHSIEDGIDHLTIATSDRPGILSQLAGALAARGVNILGGSAFTRDDGMAIDVLRVESLARMEEDWWDGVCGDVALALDDQFPIEEQLAARQSAPAASAVSVPTTVYVDNDPSSEFTKVEVNSVDRVGLLYALTRAIASCGIDIHLASVDTAGPLAVDTFYVRRPDGGRIEDTAVIEQLKDTVISAVAKLA
jgi:[protein-PII] uridylyltransferase